MEQEQTPSIFDEIQQQNPVTYATTGQRFANFIVDIIVAYLFALIVIIIVMAMIPSLAYAAQENSDSAGFKIIDRLTTSILIALFYTLIEGFTKGKTLGKAITKTKAVREDGNPFTWKDAFARSFARIVPFDPLSGLSGHPWHDKWTKTIVVKDNGLNL